MPVSYTHLAEIGGKNVVSLLGKKDVYGSRAAAHVENGFAGQYPGPFDEFFGVGAVSYTHLGDGSEEDERAHSYVPSA